MNLIRAIEDHRLFGTWLAGFDLTRWLPLLRAFSGERLRGAECGLWTYHTERSRAPEGGSNELWLVCGRRSGKSRVMALLAVWAALRGDWRAHAARGEVPTVAVVAQDRNAARVVHRYVAGLFRSTLALRGMISGDLAGRLELTNGCAIEIFSASSVSVRGYSLVAAVLDEIAHWPKDTASDPDEEILAALRPGLATIPGSLLVAASSPHARRGELWRHYRDYFGQDGADVIVWRGTSLEMNPTLNPKVVERELERDPARANAEWNAIFRTDVEAFVSREVVEALVSPRVFERVPVSNVRYSGFIDPSGGSADSYCLAIGHREGDVAVLDLLRERKPPFSPEAVTAEYAETLKGYGLIEVTGDRYSAQWVQEQFRKRGINYRVSEKTKSELYLECLPVFNSGKAELLDNQRLIGQFCALERRTSRTGRDAVDHPPGAADDLSNVVAGVVGLCQAGRVAEWLPGTAYVVGELAAARADWAPGPGTPGARTRPGDCGYTSGAPAGGPAVFSDQMSPWFGEL